MLEEGSKGRREYKRIPAFAVVEIRKLDESGLTDESGSALAAEASSLSVGGLLLTTDEEFSFGSLVSVKLDLDSAYDLNVGWEREGEERDQTLTAVCRVVRVKGAAEIGYEVAVQFQEILGGDQTALERFLEGS